MLAQIRFVAIEYKHLLWSEQVILLPPLAFCGDVFGKLIALLNAIEDHDCVQLFVGEDAFDHCVEHTPLVEVSQTIEAIDLRIGRVLDFYKVD